MAIHITYWRNQLTSSITCFKDEANDSFLIVSFAFWSLKPMPVNSFVSSSADVAMLTWMVQGNGNTGKVPKVANFGHEPGHEPFFFFCFKKNKAK